MTMKWWYCIVFMSLCGSQALARQIPMYRMIPLQITGRDTSLLRAYNIYSFNYTNGNDTFSADFLVLKPDDNIRYKSSILAKLQPVTEFMIVPPDSNGKKLVIQTESGIEVKGREPDSNAYLNFDPMLPDPVFMLLELAEDKHK
jgi:hypothetical protein